MAQPLIIYEDNHIIVAEKPRNMPVQGDISGDMDFLSVIKEYVRVKYKKPGEAYIGLVHRLDRPVGGVMVFARTSKAAARLSAAIKQGSFFKEYYAVVKGKPADEAVLRDYLLKDGKRNVSSIVKEGTVGAKYAELAYSLIEQRQNSSLLKVILKTGRAHQIRVQLAGTGLPIIGDAKYGAGGRTLSLWSARLGFEHPTKKEYVQFSYLPPNEWPWNLFEYINNDR